VHHNKLSVIILLKDHAIHVRPLAAKSCMAPIDCILRIEEGLQVKQYKLTGNKTFSLWSCFDIDVYSTEFSRLPTAEFWGGIGIRGIGKGRERKKEGKGGI